MSYLKLISVDLLYNYVEQGDKLYITATWQNSGDTAPDFDAKIVADIVFGDSHRLETTQCDNYSFAWRPFPTTDMWKAGEVWTTTGAWAVTPTWGGSYNLSLSLKEESGKTVEFIGKNGEITHSQFITEIDIGWGWGRPRLLEQRKPLSIEINPLGEVISENLPEYEVLEGFKLNTKYPSACGFENESWYDLPTVLTLRRIADNRTLKFIGDKGISYSLNKPSEAKAVYSAQNEYCSFEAVLEKEKGYITLSLENITETEGFELIELEIPSLAQINNGTLTNYFGGGRGVEVACTLPQTAQFYYDSCNAVGAASEKTSFAVVANDVDNVLRQSVIQKNSIKTGVIGAAVRIKIKADKQGLKSIPVELKPLEIHFSGGFNSLLSAEALREKLPESFSKLYENTLLYKIRMDASGQYNPERPETYSAIITLEEVRKIILQVYNISGGARQVVYLVGWQKGGHDFEYPYPYLTGFNPKCGSLEEFNALREELKQYNVELSLHDNFDDAYLSDSYQIKEEMLSKNSRGENWKGWLWAGGMSYIISPSDYLKTEDIKERIDSVVKDYGIEGTYHLDVLSSEIRRYSFAQNKPSCAADNIKGKLGIIKMFNQKGIDITSETLSLPFIGKIGYAQNTRYSLGARLFLNEEVIPLTTVALHGVTPYKMGADGGEASMLNAIACGASCSIEIEENTEDMTSIRNMARNIYIVSVPMSALSYKRVVDADIRNGKWTLEYEDNSYVVVDFKEKTYTIVCEGVTVSENFTTFMPLKSGKYCYYTLKGNSAEVKLPDDWTRVRLSAITANASGIITEKTVENGLFIFEATADTPYIIEKAE